jgi:energy-coupling factor transporter ATP-binding protein EcfA2
VTAVPPAAPGRTKASEHTPRRPGAPSGGDTAPASDDAADRPAPGTSVSGGVAASPAYGTSPAGTSVSSTTDIFGIAETFGTSETGEPSQALRGQAALTAPKAPGASPSSTSSPKSLASDGSTAAADGEAEARGGGRASAVPTAAAPAVGTGTVPAAAVADPAGGTMGGQKTGSRNAEAVADRAQNLVDLVFFRSSRHTGPDTALWEFGANHGRVTQAPDRATGPSPRRGFSRPLYQRLEALRELVGLSGTLLDTRTLADVSRVLEEATARHRLSLEHTVVAIAGASGSGKSALFNAIAGASFSEAGMRRPTTSMPVACAWSGDADGLLDRIGVQPRLRRRPSRPDDFEPHGLVLIDLPDHDSAATGRPEQVDRWLRLVDAVVWVVDPEKYADAVLHEHYLRPLAGYSGVTFVVLNQIDRLPGDVAGRVLDDLRRLLKEDGLTFGEHGEPGAVVLAVSALTGEGVTDLRHHLARFCAEGQAAERRLSADIECVAARLRPSCLAEGRGELAEEARAAFEDRLADAVGAAAAGQVAERVWLHHAELACEMPWTWLRHWWAARHLPPPMQDSPPYRAYSGESDNAARCRAWGHFADGRLGSRGSAEVPRRATKAPSVARAVVEQAVRTVTDEASAGLPDVWVQAMRKASARGAESLPEALEEATAQAAGTARRAGSRWWLAGSVAQGLLFLLQVLGALWLVWIVVNGPGGDAWLLPAGVVVIGVAGAQVLVRCCRFVARGPARRYGQEAEQRLRNVAALCGRAQVLDPIVAELLRYRDVRGHYEGAAGDAMYAALSRARCGSGDVRWPDPA